MLLLPLVVLPNYPEHSRTRNIRQGVLLEDQNINVKVIGTTGGEGGIKALQESNNPQKDGLVDFTKCFE